MYTSIGISDPAFVNEVKRRVFARLPLIARPCDTSMPAERGPCGNGPRCLPVGVSARHVHLTREHFTRLFGDRQVRQAKKLMGGQFSTDCLVSLAGPNGRSIQNVRLLGPFRRQTQVEVSRTDCRTLGVNPPVRDSGDLDGASEITLIGPRGSLRLNESLIVAKRHVHMPPSDAAKFKVTDGQTVSVRLRGSRGGVLDNVLVRVSPSYTLELHVDTDEANAFGVTDGGCGTLTDISEAT